ncbi:sensor domain-containing diguanylate cyclase [Desulfobacula sp.]
MPPKQTYEELEQAIQKLELSEKKVRESEERYRLAFHTSPNSINLNRASDGMYIDINDGFTKIMGYTRDDVIGKTSLFLNIWENSEDRKRLINGLSKTGYVDNMEARFVDKGGKIIVGLMSARIIQTSGEDVILSITRDITKLKNSEKALKKSEQLLSTHLLNTSIGAISWDLNFKTIEWNPAAETIFGYTKEEAIGKHITELILPEDMKELVGDIFKKILSGKGGVHSVNENITKDDRRITCDWYNTALKDVDGRNIGMASLVNDITEPKKIAEALKESEQRLKTILSATPDPIAIYNNQGETEYLNPAFVDVFGWTLDELKGKRIPFVPDDQKKITSEKLKELLRSGNKIQFESQRLTKHNDRIDVIISTSCIYNLNNKISRLIVILKDISDQKQAKKELKLLNLKLKHDATHDPLTGAPNRRAILDRLSQELFRSQRGNLKLSIGLCDIDYFKNVNDKYGHQVGDDVLCNFVKTVQNTLRPYDFVGRYGGEEFLLVIPDLPESNGLAEERIYERVRAKIAKHKMITRSGEICITISIGVANRRGDETADALIAKADAALYRAKDNGRNQLAFAD